jgi:hypothetical protein
MHHYGVFRRLLGCGAGEVGKMTRWGEINCPRCEELEAKLAKAVEAMQFWSEAVEPDIDKAIALMTSTLAELKGQGDDRVQN